MNIIDGVSRREPSVEFVRARDVGLEQAPDSAVLEYADNNGLLVVFHDVNTMPGHAKDRMHVGKTISGLLMVQQSAAIGLIIDNLVLIWSASELEEWQQQIRFLPL